MNRSSVQFKESFPPKSNYRVAVIGSTGYGGLQIIRLLSQHPNFSLEFLGGKRSAGKKWNNLHPFLPLPEDPIIEEPEPEIISKKADYVILCLPNGLASQLVPKLLNHNVKIIDLSADYRFSSLNTWEHNYLNEARLYDRSDDNICREAVYGLPEWYKMQIANARVVASTPG